MQKQGVLNAVMAQLKQQLERLKAANRGATESATDCEFRAETKWDTGGLEASYLARGYAKQFEEIAKQLETLRNFDLKDAPADRVGLGSLVQTQTGDFTDWIFILPCSGGMEVKIEGSEVTIVTPESPLANQLQQKRRGSPYKIPGGVEGRILTIA